jgi:hypothetical protein
VTSQRHNPLAHRARPEPVWLDQTPIEGPLKKLDAIEFAQVRRSCDEPLFNSLIEHHHYLGYERPVGEHLKYLVSAARTLIRSCGRRSMRPTTDVE